MRRKVTKRRAGWGGDVAAASAFFFAKKESLAKEKTLRNCLLRVEEEPFSGVAGKFKDFGRLPNGRVFAAKEFQCRYIFCGLIGSLVENETPFPFGEIQRISVDDRCRSDRTGGHDVETV